MSLRPWHKHFRQTQAKTQNFQLNIVLASKHEETWGEGGWNRLDPLSSPTHLFQAVGDMLGGELEERSYELTGNLHSHYQGLAPLCPNHCMAHQTLFNSLWTIHAGMAQSMHGVTVSS